MDLMGSVPAPQKHKKRSVSFASQAEVQTLTPEGGHQVLTSAPISTPKRESQSAKPDPKPVGIFKNLGLKTSKKVQFLE